MARKTTLDLQYYVALYFDSRYTPQDIITIKNKQYISFLCGSCGDLFNTRKDTAKNKEKTNCKKCESIVKLTKWHEDFSCFVKENGAELTTQLNDFLIEVSSPTKANHHKLDFKCLCGKPFKTSATKFKSQNKKQCNDCGKEMLIEKNRVKINDVLEFVENNSDCTLISNEIKNVKENLVFSCSCGEMFTTTFDTFKNHNKRTCDKCTNIKLRDMYSKGLEAFKKEVFELVGDEYEIVGEYINTNTNTTMYHKECGEKYSVRPASFLVGRRCPICNNSKGEQRVKQFLDDNGYSYSREFIFQDLCGLGGGYLRYDFSVDTDFGQVLIEYDGVQHSEWLEHFMSYESYLRLIEHDRMKNEYCAKKNIRLIRITHNEFDMVEDILRNKLVKKEQTNMDKFTVRCTKSVSDFFIKGKTYEAFWDGDGYNEPSSLITTDERGKSPHIIAEHSLEDDWFNEHFVVVGNV